MRSRRCNGPFSKRVCSKVYGRRGDVCLSSRPRTDKTVQLTRSKIASSTRRGKIRCRVMRPTSAREPLKKELSRERRHIRRRVLHIDSWLSATRSTQPGSRDGRVTKAVALTSGQNFLVRGSSGNVVAKSLNVPPRVLKVMAATTAITFVVLMLGYRALF